MSLTSKGRNGAVLEGWGVVGVLLEEATGARESPKGVEGMGEGENEEG